MCHPLTPPQRAERRLSHVTLHRLARETPSDSLMMACARAAFAARVEAPAPGRHASTRVVAAQNAHVHGTASSASSRAFARLGAKRSARSHVASAQAVAVNKATRSIDEMDMDPEHVTFASSDELDARCVRLPFSSRAPRAEPRGGGAGATRAHRETRCRGRRARRYRRQRRVSARGRAPSRASFRAPVSSRRQRGNPSRSRGPTSPPRGRYRVGPSLPARGPRAPRREAPRPAHATTRGGSGRGTSLRFRPGALPPRPSLTVAHPPPSSRLFSRFLSSPLAALVAVASLPAAPRWTAPAACASWTSTTSPRP